MPIHKRKATKRSDVFKPFENLKHMLENASVELPAEPADAYFEPVVVDPGIEDETEMFMSVMTGVEPILRGKHYAQEHPPEIFSVTEIQEKSDELRHLEDLVNHGEGFVIADMPEYIEGSAHEINPQILKRLHQGDFAIQAFIDLHGFSVLEAKEKIDEFLKESVRTGKRGVLIVHGRGLSSPREPVLKTRVQEWLTSGYWRRWVIGYSSARSCDGGTGATYVLLRQKPVSKKRRKKKR